MIGSATRRICQHTRHPARCVASYWTPTICQRKDKFPLAKQARYIEATLEAGDCMYVPAYYYVETKTLTKQGKGISIIINH